MKDEFPLMELKLVSLLRKEDWFKLFPPYLSIRGVRSCIKEAVEKFFLIILGVESSTNPTETSKMFVVGVFSI